MHIFIEGGKIWPLPVVLNDQTVGSVFLCRESISASTLFLDSIHYFTLKALVAGPQPPHSAFCWRMT